MTRDFMSLNYCFTSRSVIFPGFQDEAIDDVGIHSRSSALAASTDRSLVLTLLGLMEGHPEWGIKVTKPAQDTSLKPDEDSSAVQALVGGFGNFDLVRVGLSPWPPSASGMLTAHSTFDIFYVLSQQGVRLSSLN